LISKNYLKNLLEEAEFIIKKCLNYNFSKLQKQDKKELFKKKDLKIIGDEIISKKISDYLEKTTSIKVISEENFKLISHDFLPRTIFWLLDPIDGSANLSRNLDHSYISVCLISEEGFPLLSVIGSIKDKTTRSSIVKNSLIFNQDFNQKDNKVDLNDLFITSGFPINLAKKDLNDYVYKLNLFKKVRMYGSAVGSLLLVADKKIDVYYEKSIFSWDVAGALLQVLMNGGDYCIRSINTKFSTLEVIASSDPKIMIYLKDILGEDKKLWSRKVFYL
tara:strand:+ start:668 stop:1495 length:828 start_codon:yes stop_codon:yes gene_type:complete